MSTDAPLLPDPAELPDDPVFLKRLVVQLFELLRQRDQRLSKLEHHLDLLLKRIMIAIPERLRTPKRLEVRILPGVLRETTRTLCVSRGFFVLPDAADRGIVNQNSPEVAVITGKVGQSLQV